MSLNYNFLLTNRDNPKVPHLLVLSMSQRTGRFSWAYYRIDGNKVFQGQKPNAAGNDVRYGMSAAEFDLYDENSNKFGTLTIINKSLNSIATGDRAVFEKFTGSTDDAVFTKTTNG